LIVRNHPLCGVARREAMVLEEQVLRGMALYWWVVFVLWATRRGWE
jgi:hypothetical protein